MLCPLNLPDVPDVNCRHSFLDYMVSTRVLLLLHYLILRVSASLMNEGQNVCLV